MDETLVAGDDHELNMGTLTEEVLNESELTSTPSPSRDTVSSLDLNLLSLSLRMRPSLDCPLEDVHSLDVN